MSVLSFRRSRGHLLRGSVIAVALGVATAAVAQTQLPEVVVTAPKQKEKPKPKPTQAPAAPRPALAPAQATAPAPAAQPVSPGAQLNAKAETFDQARNNLFTTIGTTSSVISQSGTNFDVCAYFPPFSRLSAARFSHRYGARFCHRGRRAKPASRGRRDGAKGERKAETQTHSGACRPAPGASAGTSDRTGACCATGYAGRAAQRQGRRVQHQERSNLYTTIGTTSDVISSRHDPAHFPAATTTPVEKILLQAPGVSQDSAASGLLHVRNDHANVQFRINGVMLPDGLTGFGSILDASWIGSIALVVGALPAEYGLRTVGLVDITTRADIFNNSGQVSVYGGSQGTLTPTIQYGGTFGSTCPTITPAPGTRALPSCGLLPGRPILLYRPLPANQGRPRKFDSPPTARSTTSRNRRKASPICRRSSTPIRGSV